MGLVAKQNSDFWVFWDTLIKNDQNSQFRGPALKYVSFNHGFSTPPEIETLTTAQMRQSSQDYMLWCAGLLLPPSVNTFPKAK